MVSGKDAQTSYFLLEHISVLFSLCNVLHVLIDLLAPHTAQVLLWAVAGGAAEGAKENKKEGSNI